MTRSAPWLAALLSSTAAAQAPAPTVEPQPQAVIAVTLDVQPRTFTVPATLTITWTAGTGTTGCMASGGWNGARPISGSEQVAGVAGSTSFYLSCDGPTPQMRVSWVNPTKNTDGSNYTDAKHIEVYRADSAQGLANATAVAVAHPATSYQFAGLPVGVSYFATKAVNQAGAKSALSSSVSANVEGASGTAPPVTVTGSTAPPPTGMVSISQDGYAVKPNLAVIDYVLDGIVGRVQLGAPCDVARQMGGTDYYAINRQKYVTWTTNRRPSTVVVQCAAAAGGTAVESEPAPLGVDPEEYGK
jgi:hypothetical protein